MTGAANWYLNRYVRVGEVVRTIADQSQPRSIARPRHTFLVRFQLRYRRAAVFEGKTSVTRPRQA